MSNSKWTKLLAVLVDNCELVKQCLVKPIWDEEKPFRRLLFDKHTRYDFDYYASAMEAMVSGNPKGWYAYKEIEWLDFPLLVTMAEKAAPATQDLAAIKALLDKTGQYSIELTESNLRLYGYFK